MLSETDREHIRRAFYLEHKSIRQLAKEEGCSRDTIRRAISHAPPKLYQLTRPKPAPVFGPYHLRAEALLRQNEHLPRKQRYTAHRIFAILHAEGYQGSESTVRHYISACKSASQHPDVFLPLEFEPGQDGQVDWGEAFVVLAGQRQKVQVFLMRLCFSRRTFAIAFPSQAQESFFWGHVQAFQHFGGVPHRISYDNLGTAVKLAFEDTDKTVRKRREVRAFVAFRSHYLFASHFCSPGQATRKARSRAESGTYAAMRWCRSQKPPPSNTSISSCLNTASRKIVAGWRVSQKPLEPPGKRSDRSCSPCRLQTMNAAR